MRSLIVEKGHYFTVRTVLELRFKLRFWTLECFDDIWRLILVRNFTPLAELVLNIFKVSLDIVFLTQTLR